MFNQLSGINAILYYLNAIFEHAGFSKVSGDLQAVAMERPTCCSRMIAMSVIDKVDAKALARWIRGHGALPCRSFAAIFLTGRHENAKKRCSQ